MTNIREALTNTILDDITDLDRAKALAAKYLATLEYDQIVACIQDAGLELPDDAETRYRAENILIGLEVDFQSADYAEYDKTLGRVVLQRHPSLEEERDLPELYTILPENIERAAAELIAANNTKQNEEDEDNAPF